MSDNNNDFVLKAIARAKQVAARLGGAGGLNIDSFPANNGDQSSSIGTKRSANDNIFAETAEKRRNVGDKLSAAAEAAARINEKLGASTVSPLANQTVTVYHKIPDKCVGLVIGRKGEQIIQLQQEACCKVQVSQEGGQAEREVTMIGTPSQIEKAKQLISDIIERSGGAAAHSIDLMIPGLRAGLIIGKNGDTIKSLQEASGAKLMLIQDSSAPTQDDKPLRITGDAQCVEKAKELVIQLLSNKDGKGGYQKQQQQPYGQPNLVNIDLCVYAVPTEKAGLVIGKGGETIREICTSSGAFVEISKQQKADAYSKYFNIRGQPHEIESALRHISDRAGIPVGAPYSYQPGGGQQDNNNQQQQQQQSVNYGNNQQYGDYGGGQVDYNQQSSQQAAAAAAAGAVMPGPSVNPQTGQVDYSAAWAEYYRRQGLTQYADMLVNQTAQQQQQAANTANEGGQSVGYDYSQQWQQQQQQQQEQSAAVPAGSDGVPSVTTPQQPQPEAHQRAAWANAAQSGYGGSQGQY